MRGFTQNGKAAVLIDGQWGSTGKGLVSAWLAQSNFVDTATTNASANAGHTSIVAGKVTVCYHLPTACTTGLGKTIAYLNAGSIIDPELLHNEIERVRVQPGLVFIHPWAAVITEEDKQYELFRESGATKVASTQKGVGAALSRKIRREGPVAQDIPSLSKYIAKFSLISELEGGNSVLIEVPQGVHLGIHSTNAYPYCTSREVSVAQALSDAELPPYFLGKVMMVLRTYPIRVGDIADAEGNKIGSSGPCFPDQREMEWREIGVDPERTTVTKRIRRVFSWSRVQITDAIRRNRPDYVFLNFCNYLTSVRQLEERVNDVVAAGSKVAAFGFGPAVEDVVTSLDDAVKRIRENEAVA